MSQQKQSSRILSIILNFSRVFCSTSTVHGFNQMVETGRHPPEKIIWLCMVTGAVLGAGIFSNMALSRYRETPTVISMERDRFSWNTSFPAATFCPLSKLNERLLEKYVDESTAENKTLFKQFLSDLAGANFYNFEQLVNHDHLRPDEYLKVLLQLKFEFDPAVSNSGSDQNEYFLQETISEMGICYSYNSKLAVYNAPNIATTKKEFTIMMPLLTPNTGNIPIPQIQESEQKWSIPTFNCPLPFVLSMWYRAILSQLAKYYGVDSVSMGDLSLCSIHRNYNNDVCIVGSNNKNDFSYWNNGHWNLIEGNETFFLNPIYGEIFANIFNMSTDFHIYIHGPYEVADISSKYTLSEQGYFLQMYLIALSLFSSDRSRYLSVNQRKCRFHDESNLKHAPAYSYVLCKMECRIALSKKLCGCIPHFYRKLDGDVVCDVPGLHCLSKYKERLIFLKKECSCVPNCDEVNYIIEELIIREWFFGSNLQWGMRQFPKMRLKRDVIFGFTDLLVSIGGMAGLFLGCSVLSFIEIIYFFSIKLFWFVIKYKEDTEHIIRSK